MCLFRNGLDTQGRLFWSILDCLIHLTVAFLVIMLDLGHLKTPDAQRRWRLVFWKSKLGYTHFKLMVLKQQLIPLPIVPAMVEHLRALGGDSSRRLLGTENTLSSPLVVTASIFLLTFVLLILQRCNEIAKICSSKARRCHSIPKIPKHMNASIMDMVQWCLSRGELPSETPV